MSVIFCSGTDSESVVVEYNGLYDLSISRIGKH